MTSSPIEFVSFGAEYQRDLDQSWVEPAARSIGQALVPHDLSFLGMRQPHLGAWGYHNLIGMLGSGELAWDIVQVEDHCVYLPETLGVKQVFAEFPHRIVNNLPVYLQNPRAVPAACGGYMLAWRTDTLTGPAPGWRDFFDRNAVRGKRALRDFPTGTIEIALVALGCDLRTDFYDPALNETTIRRRVVDAINQIDGLGNDVVWWNQGYQSAQQLVSGDVAMSALWNRNLLKANSALGADVNDPDKWVIQVNAATSFIATDWFVVVQGTGKEIESNRLLEAMFNDPEVLKGAAHYAAMQGNTLPLANMPPAGPGIDYALRLGTWENPRACGFLNTKFWGRHWPWISDMWKVWRIERGGAPANSFFQSPPPPVMSEAEREARHGG